MGQKENLIRQVAGAMGREIAPIPGEVMSLGNIEKRLEEINQQVGLLIAQAADAGDSAGYQGQLKVLLDETTALKEKRAFIQEQRGKNAAAFTQLKNAVSVMENASAEIAQWDESMIRQLVDTVKVVSREKIIVCLRGGVKIKQDMV